MSGRIFVVGFPRSGTTLVQSLLSAHSAVLSFPETHFFFQHFRQPLDRLPLPVGWVDRIALPHRRSGYGQVREMLHAAGVKVDGPGDALSPAEAARVLVRALDEAVRSAGLSAWLEKTPGHVRRIRSIGRFCENARFVHVIRRFPPVQRSWQRAASQHPDSPFAALAGAARRNWHRDLARTFYWSARAPREHFVVTYAAVCGAPEQTAARLLAFCSLDWDPRVLSDASTQSQVIAPEERWKANNALDIRPAQGLDLGGGDDVGVERYYERVVESLRSMGNAATE